MGNTEPLTNVDSGAGVGNQLDWDTIAAEEGYLSAMGAQLYGGSADFYNLSQIEMHLADNPHLSLDESALAEAQQQNQDIMNWYTNGGD